MNELYPDVKDFKFSDQWFTRFRTRKNISLRKRTHAAQRAPVNLSATISSFMPNCLE